MLKHGDSTKFNILFTFLEIRQLLHTDVFWNLKQKKKMCYLS